MKCSTSQRLIDINPLLIKLNQLQECETKKYGERIKMIDIFIELLCVQPVIEKLD